MNQMTKRRVRVAAATALAISMVTWIDLRTKAQDAAPATQPSGQTVDALVKDAEKQFDSLQDVLNSPDVQIDPVKRAAAAPQAIPSFKRLVADFDALTKADPDNAEEAADRRTEFTMFLSLFGDADATKTLADLAASKDPKQALEGKRSQLMVSWLSSANDPAAQAGLVDQTETFAKANPTSNSLTVQIFRMSRIGVSSPDVGKRLVNLLTDVMKSDVAADVQKQLSAEQKLQPMVDKPLIISGKQIDGKDITTADWNGKVVLVDFWATWCPPCVAGIPRVTKVYEEYHPKGLEIIGVSNDSAADTLSKFLASHPGMAWPQLFDDATSTGSNFGALTLKLGIGQLPTMFLIDKKGIVRSVTAEDDLDTMIPKLLDEK